jgi:hypothetical protein
LAKISTLPLLAKNAQHVKALVGQNVVNALFGKRLAIAQHINTLFGQTFVGGGHLGSTTHHFPFVVKNIALPFESSIEHMSPKHGFTGESMFFAGPEYCTDQNIRANSGIMVTGSGNAAQVIQIMEPACGNKQISPQLQIQFCSTWWVGRGFGGGGVDRLPGRCGVW